MPWSNQSGGGGPWGQRGGSGGPWGAGPQGGGGSGGPPDLEDLLRRSQDRIRDFIPGGGSMGGKGLAALALLAVGIWLATGIYTVRPNEVGLNLIFGRYVGQSAQGLNWNWPYPIGSVVKPDVTAVNRIEVGYRPGGPQARARDVTEESLMLTGDGNIVDIDFDALWRVDPSRADNYAFNLQNPQGTIKAVAESAMREVVGRTPADEIRTRGRQTAQDQVRDLIQKTLDDYHSGVLITGVQLEKADPPPQVVDAFEEVQRAEQNQNKLIREAEQYRNQILGQARGDSSKIVADGKAYKSRVVAEAQGEAKRFLSVHDEYEKAKDVTRQRLFLETIEDVLQKSNKVIIDEGKAGPGVVPYLPLPELQKRQPPPARTATTGGQ